MNEYNEYAYDMQWSHVIHQLDKTDQQMFHIGIGVGIGKYSRPKNLYNVRKRPKYWKADQSSLQQVDAAQI